MVQFAFERQKLDGVILITSFFSDDNRGSFIKHYERNVFKKNGIDFSNSETFITHSVKNVIRGLHFQTNRPQAKLVSVICGKVFDVVVDLRKDSPTYRKWEGYYLSEDNRNSLYIPRGFAHGFLSLGDTNIVQYACDGDYDKASDTGILYYDKDIGIVWPVSDVQNGVIVSEKDKILMSFECFDRDNPFKMIK